MTKYTFNIFDNPDQNAKNILFATLMNLIILLKSNFQPMHLMTFGYLLTNVKKMGVVNGLLTVENVSKMTYILMLLKHIYSQNSRKKQYLGLGFLYMIIQTFVSNDKLVHIYIKNELNNLTDEEVINKNIMSIMTSFNDLSSSINHINNLPDLDKFGESLNTFHDSYQNHLRELLNYYNCFSLQEKNIILGLISEKTKKDILKQYNEEDEDKIIRVISQFSKSKFDINSDISAINALIKQFNILNNAFNSLNHLKEVIAELKCTCHNNPEASAKAIKVDIENNIGVNIPYLFYMVNFKMPIMSNQKHLQKYEYCDKFQNFLKVADNEKSFVSLINREFQILINSKRLEAWKPYFLSLNKNSNPLFNKNHEINSDMKDQKPLCEQLVDFFYEELNRACEGL